MDIDGFLYALNDLSTTTITNHERNIHKLDDLLDINDEPKTNIKILYKQEKRIPTLMSLYKTLLKYLHYIDDTEYINEYNNEYNKIKCKYDDNKKKDTRKMLIDSVYDANDLYNRLEQFYKNKEYTAYIITYILLNYNTRNQDLDLKILTSDHKVDIKNDNNNYLIIYKTMVKIYIGTYKTANIYGPKLFIIRDKKFIKAINSIYDTRDKLLINNSNLTTEITKYTPYNLNEVDILKILLKHNNNIEYYKRASECRGTDYKTLVEKYSNL